MGLVTGRSNEISRSRANSASGNDGTPQAKPKSWLAKLFSRAGNKAKTSSEAQLAETPRAASDERRPSVGALVTSVTTSPSDLPVRFTDIQFTDEELEAELYAIEPEPNDVAVAPESTGNDATAARWERTVDGKLADLSDIEDALTKIDDDFAARNLLDETLGDAEPLELGMLDKQAQDATRRWSAATDPTAASGGPAAAAKPAPSSALGNSTCASQFDARAVNILFKMGDPAQTERLLGIFENSENDYAKVIIVDFAKLLTLSFRKILDDGNLSKEQKKQLVAPLKSLVKDYINLIESEGLDKKSPFGPFYFGQKDTRNKRMNLEGELVVLSGGKNADGAKKLRDALIKDTVRPFIDARLKEMFGGKPSGDTTSLMEKMVEERAQAVLDKIGVAAENYSKNHGGASVRGLSFGFSLVTLWPELLRKIWDDETPATAAAQGGTPAAAPAENDDPAPAANDDPAPTVSPEAALPGGNGRGAGGGMVINGNVSININNSDNRSYNNRNGNMTLDRDGVMAAMGPGDDVSDVSSESGYSALTEDNLAAIGNDEVDRGIFTRDVTEDRSVQNESVARSLNESGDSASLRSSGYESNDEQSKGALRHRISESSPLTPESFTLQSKFLPSAQGASAIESVIIDRPVSDVLNGWVQIKNDDGKKSWTQMLMNKLGELEASEFKAVELTRNRREARLFGGVKTGAPELPHPWADSEWIKGNRLSREIARKQIQAEDTLMVGDAFNAAKLAGRQDADDAYFSE